MGRILGYDYDEVYRAIARSEVVKETIMLFYAAELFDAYQHVEALLEVCGMEGGDRDEQRELLRSVIKEYRREDLRLERGLSALFIEALAANWKIFSRLLIHSDFFAEWLTVKTCLLAMESVARKDHFDMHEASRRLNATQKALATLLDLHFRYVQRTRYRASSRTQGFARILAAVMRP